MAKSEKDMRSIAAMLVCPHQWSAARKVTIVDGKKGRRNAEQSTCQRCGTHRVKYDDGTGAMISPDGLSDKPNT